MLASLAAQPACPVPAMPSGPGIAAQSALEAYVRALDTYAVCRRGEAASLAPLDAVNTLEAYKDAFATMQQAVDGYNAGLPRASSGP